MEQAIRISPSVMLVVDNAMNKRGTGLNPQQIENQLKDSRSFALNAKHKLMTPRIEITASCVCPPATFATIVSIKGKPFLAKGNGIFGCGLGVHGEDRTADEWIEFLNENRQ